MVRAGIAGTGRIVGLHAEACRAAGVEVVAVAGSDRERAESTARRLGVPQALSVAELIGDETIDVIHVAGRNAGRPELCVAAAVAGKHLVIEKPVAFTADAARSIARAVERSGVRTLVCLSYLGFPAIARARTEIASGRLGTIRLVHGSYLQDWLALDTDDDWRCDPSESGPTRALGDIGVHWFSLLEHLVGDEVVSVRADLAHVVSARAEGDDVALVSARLGAGGLANSVISQVSHGHENDVQIEVVGERASLWWSSADPRS